jgi:hypothetical protein
MLIGQNGSCGREWRMHWRDRLSIYQKRLGSVLTASGVLVWRFRQLTPQPRDQRDVAIGHFEGRSLAVIAGGASVASGVALLATAV